MPKRTVLHRLLLVGRPTGTRAEDEMAAWARDELHQAGYATDDVEGVLAEFAAEVELTTPATEPEFGGLSPSPSPSAPCVRAGFAGGGDGSVDHGRGEPDRGA
jgi:hypothetical protein